MEKAEIMENPDMESREAAEADEVIAGVTEVTAPEAETAAAVPEKEDKEENSNYPSQAVLTIRAIVGGYVMYLAYQIITSDSELTPLMWAAVILFIVAGAGLIIMSVKHFICKEYK